MPVNMGGDNKYNDTLGKRETFLTQSRCQDSCLQVELYSGDPCYIIGWIFTLNLFHIWAGAAHASVALSSGDIRHQDVCQ